MNSQALDLPIASRGETDGAGESAAKAISLLNAFIYFRIRNPICLLGGLLFAGAMLWAGQPRLVLCFAVLVP